LKVSQTTIIGSCPRNPKSGNLESPGISPESRNLHYTDYAFDVKATVAGQFDVLHVVADYYALYTGEPQVAVSYPDSAAVVADSGDTNR